MKLSHAIREGAKKRGQAFGHYMEPGLYINGNVEHVTCALGAAYEAITGALPLYDSLVIDVINKSTGIRDAVIAYPEGMFWDSEGFIKDVVAHLNDMEHWSREQIADYLESLGY